MSAKSDIDIEPGWIPVELNSELEYKFTDEKQRTLSDGQDYFITRTIITIGTTEFENYLPYQIGNE